jgi:hypothetical protein
MGAVGAAAELEISRVGESQLFIRRSAINRASIRPPRKCWKFLRGIMSEANGEFSKLSRYSLEKG